MKPKLHIGAIFIAYNAEKTLEKFYQEFPRSLVESVILVDDASQDGTYDLAVKLGIPAYRNPVNLGYGGNMKRALELAKESGMDVIIDLHPDGEYDSSAIPAALEKIEAGSDFVLGNRFTTASSPLKNGMYPWKIIPILLLNHFARFALRTDITDLHQGFRVYTKRLLNSVNYENNSDGYLFSFELIAQALFANLKICQVPVHTHYSGKKRGASLKNSILYTLGVFKVISLFFAAKIGMRAPIFRKVCRTV